MAVAIENWISQAFVIQIHMRTKTKSPNKRSWVFQMVYMMQLNIQRVNTSHAHTGKPACICDHASQHIDSSKNTIESMSMIMRQSVWLCCMLQHSATIAVHTPLHTWTWYLQWMLKVCLPFHRDMIHTLPCQLAWKD